MLALLSAALAPGIALLSYFYLKDQFETEPLSRVLKIFFYGALLVVPLMFLEYIVETENLLINFIGSSFLTSALIEEFFKWFILIFTIFSHVEFDEPYDGIVYGVAISLGFATLENIFYLFANGLNIAVARALLPVSSHALFGVIMGYYLGKAKFTKPNSMPFLLMSFLVPFILHGLYNMILLKSNFPLYWILPYMVFLWWFGMKKVKKARMVNTIHY